ncbi:MAG: 50S ribosomal protein L15 [Elusimicrobia bacterium]|nr:50S ribosomal protein L15 [Elusimicrobiota bacterium]
MFSLFNLHPSPGSHHRRKIVGRGVGSGHGRHATRGMKGQRSRRGDSKMVGFEGGQMPLLRRIPKQGFTPPFKEKLEIVNLAALEEHFENNSTVSPQTLLEKGLIRTNLPLKILGSGEIKKSLKVSAQHFSQNARVKIGKAGGEVQVLLNAQKSK